MLSHLTAEDLVTQEGFDARGKGGPIHPRHSITIVTVDEPFLDAARVEGHDRQSVTHPLQTHRAEGFGPDRTDADHAALAIVNLHFLRRSPALEMNPIRQPQPLRQPLAK